MRRKVTNFQQYISERVERIPIAGCWLWTQYVAPDGYAKAMRNSLAHRISYEAFNGPIPEGMCVCHRCDVRSCVNPGHLFLGTDADNLQDRVAKGRSSHGERHGTARLTDEQAHSIFNDPRTHRVIAAEYGVGHSTVGTIKRLTSWKHIHA